MLFCFLVLMANCLSFIFHAQVGSEAKGHHLNLMTLEPALVIGFGIYDSLGQFNHVAGHTDFALQVHQHILGVDKAGINSKGYSICLLEVSVSVVSV